MKRIKEQYSYFYSYNIRFYVHVYDIAHHAIHHGVLHELKPNASSRLAVQRREYSRHREILLFHLTTFLLYHLLCDDHSGSSGFHADSLCAIRLWSFPGDRVRVFMKMTRNNSIITAYSKFRILQLDFYTDIYCLTIW